MDGLTIGPKGSLGPLSDTQRLMLRGVGIFAALLLVGGMAGNWPAHAGFGGPRAAYTGTAVAGEPGRLLWSFDSTTGEMELARLEIYRAQTISAYGAQYGISADLVRLIYDIAVQEGIDPELAFRLVKLESEFKPDARSPVGALGLAQVMLPTAMNYQRGITEERLLDPQTNLRIGFRFLYDLLGHYGGDLQLALLAYNRGPARVNELLDRGRDPRNGYAEKLMNGYRPAASP